MHGEVALTHERSDHLGLVDLVVLDPALVLAPDHVDAAHLRGLLRTVDGLYAHDVLRVELRDGVEVLPSPAEADQLLGDGGARGGGGGRHGVTPGRVLRDSGVGSYVNTSGPAGLGSAASLDHAVRGPGRRGPRNTHALREPTCRGITTWDVGSAEENNLTVNLVRFGTRRTSPVPDECRPPYRGNKL